MSTNSKFDEILTNDETRDQFCEWFWKGNIKGTTNSNSLVEALNTSTHRSTDYVRKEKFRPCIYGVSLKYKYHKDWQFVKIGVTQVDTSVDVSRMTNITKDIEKAYGINMGSVMFVLPIDPIDTRTYIDVEKTIRQKLGIPVQKKLAKKLSLPVPTEWVISTTAYNKKITDEIKEATKKRNAHTGLLKYKFEAKIALPSSLTPPKDINEGETVQICMGETEICLQESDTSKSPEASGKLTKELKERKKVKTSLQDSATSESPETSGQQATASKRTGKGEKPKI